VMTPRGFSFQLTKGSIVSINLKEFNGIFFHRNEMGT